MKAIIMAGGYGTRLQPLTLRTPKCILPIGESAPILEMINNLTELGIKEIIISLNQNQIKVKEFLENKTKKVNIKFIFEQTKQDSDKFGALGALSYVIENFGADDYFIIGADNYTKGLDYKKMLKQHKWTRADATIALFDLKDISKVSSFGVGVINKTNRIIGFQEKPKAEEAKSTLTSTFIYIIKKNFLEKNLPQYIKKEKEEGRKPDNTGDLWEYYKDKSKIYGFVFNGFWGDVGKPLPYIQINHKALDDINQRIHESVKLAKDSKINGKVIIEKNCEIEEDVTIIGPCVIKEKVTIKQGSIIGPYTTLLKGVKIGRNNIISGSILFENTKTGENVKITRALIDGYSEIKKGVRIEEQAMIGYKAIVEENSQLFYNTKLWPFLKIDKNSTINGKVCYELKQLDDFKKLKESKYWE